MVTDVVSAIEKANLKELDHCYVFFGNNDYYKLRIIKLLKQKFQKLGADTFDFWSSSPKDTDITDLLNNAFASPFLAPHKVLIYKDIDSISEQDAKFLGDYFAAPAKSSSLFLFFNNKKQALMKIFKKNVIVVKFDADMKNEINGLIVTMLKQNSKKISSRVLNVLQTCLAGNSILGVVNDMQKLITYVGDRDTITEEDVFANFSKVDSFTIFNLIDDIAKGNKKEAIRKLNNIMQAGTSPQEILAMVYWNFKRVWSFHELKTSGLAEGRILENIGIKSWAKAPFMNQVRKFSKEGLKKIFSLLFDADIEAKKKSVPSNILLETLILNIFSAAK